MNPVWSECGYKHGVLSLLVLPTREQFSKDYQHFKHMC